MKNAIKILGFIGVMAILFASCNKKCSCTTSVPGFEDETIVYEKPNGKHACKVYQDNQNKILTPVNGKVACVYQ
ncbi:MAG: hypothetical protein MJZ46_08220 [Bacteroidales bacterium]|nr:hypothetical protein [Bacteroidales bacterium]